MLLLSIENGLDDVGTSTAFVINYFQGMSFSNREARSHPQHRSIPLAFFNPRHRHLVYLDNLLSSSAL